MSLSLYSNTISLEQNKLVFSISPIFILFPFPFPICIDIAPLPRVFQGIFGLSLTNLGYPIMLKLLSINLLTNKQAV